MPRTCQLLLLLTFFFNISARVFGQGVVQQAAHDKNDQKPEPDCCHPNKPALLYEFNKHGDLLNGAADFLPANTMICVKIPLDTFRLKSQLDSINGNLLEAISTWTAIRALRDIKSLAQDTSDIAQQRAAARTGFLRSTANAGSFTVKDSLFKIFLQKDSVFAMEEIQAGNRLKFHQLADMLIDDLQHLYKALHGRNMAQLLSLKKDPCRTYKFTPEPKAIVDSLLRPFTVWMTCGKGKCEIDIGLKLTPDCCGNYNLCGCCAGTPDEDAIIKVYRNDMVKNLFIDWYNQYIDLLNYKELIVFEQIASKDENFKRVLQLKLPGPKTKDWCDSLRGLDKLASSWESSPTVHYFAAHIDLVSRFFRYLLYFAWYNKNGLLQINPLGFTTPSLYRIPSAKPLKKDSTDSHVLSGVDSLFHQKNIAAITDSKQLMDLFQILYKRDSMMNRQDSIQTAANMSAQTAGPKGDSANSKALAAFQRTFVLHNQVVTPTSLKPDSMLHIRNYYFGKAADKRDFHYDYPDNERVVLAVHNVPALQNISVTASLGTFNEMPELVSDGLNQLSTMTGGLSTLISGLEGTGAFLDETQQELHLETPIKRPTPDSQAICHNTYIQRFEALEKEFRPYRWVDSMFNAAQLPPVELQKYSTDSPEVRTVLRYPDGGNKAPFEYDYKLIIKDTSKSSAGTLIDSSFYRVGKRRLVEIAMGIGWSLTPTRQTLIDTAGNSFNVSSSQNNIQFIAGLKFHFKKMYWGNNKFSLSCERWSVLTAVSIPSPLSNFYLGVGVDPVPGFNINAGLQLYRYNKYTVTNNKITDQAAVYHPAFYLSMTTDVRLFVNIITTFFK